MTICNMTIEGGGRAGMVAPDDTTFEWVEGRPGAPEDFDAAVEALARAAHRRRRDLRPGDHRRRRARSRRSSPGARTPARSSASPSAVPEPRTRDRRARAGLHGPRGRHADAGDHARPRVHRLVHEPPHRRPARRRRGGRRAARSPSSVDAMVVPGSEQVRAQAEAEGLDEVFRAAGFDWRTAGCSMCLGMNPDILQPGERCASTSNRNFEGRQGRGGRTHLVSPADGRRGRHRGPLRRHPGVELMEPVRTRSQGDGQRARPRRRRHRPDHPQAVPQADRAHRLRRVPVLRLGARSPAGTCRRTRSSPPARTSAAAPRASTRRGRCRTTASRRSSRRASPTSSSPTARRSACCRCVLPEEDVRALMEAGEAEVDLEALEVRFDGRAVPFELDADRRHRLLNGLDDIALTLQQGRRDRRLRARARAPGPGHPESPMPTIALARGRTRWSGPSRRPATTQWSRAITRRCRTPR